VLEDHPGHKIRIVHGGGHLPVYSRRMDHVYRARADCRYGVSKEPSRYLKQLYFDTVVFAQEYLVYLVSLYGADQILLRRVSWKLMALVSSAQRMAPRAERITVEKVYVSNARSPLSMVFR
jgi:hypothetical protein